MAEELIAGWILRRKVFEGAVGIRKWLASLGERRQEGDEVGVTEMDVGNVEVDGILNETLQESVAKILLLTVSAGVLNEDNRRTKERRRASAAISGVQEAGVPPTRAKGLFTTASIIFLMCAV